MNNIQWDTDHKGEVQILVQAELWPELMAVFSAYLDYSQGRGSNGWGPNPMNWETLSRWISERGFEFSSPTVKNATIDRWFEIDAIYMTTTARKAEKPKEETK